MKWFRKKHQHHPDGCMTAAVELEDGTVLCALDFVITEADEKAYDEYWKEVGA